MVVLIDIFNLIINYKTYSIKNKNDMNSRILLLPFSVFHTIDFYKISLELIAYRLIYLFYKERRAEKYVILLKREWR